ncbi:hypothetical protein [Vibrio parahaemolyticus]|nr:hypothetical protein [Vibrio parahaemolyticus]OUD46490.1 hypothetical protein BS624_10780 [Vibrio parahaemolyticus]
MKLSVGDYEEYIAGEFIGSIFGLEGDYETTVYDRNKARVSDSMFLYVDLNIENADDKAPNFEAWDLKCGDLVSKVEYNKKGN